MSPSDEEDGPPHIAVYPGGDRRPQLDRAAWPLCLVGDDDVQLLGRLTGDELLRNGVPDEVTALRRCTAHEAVLRRVGPRVDPLLARVSPLGGEWSADIDVHSVQRPDDATLAGWGWLRVDALLRWIGSDTRDRWAVREDGLVVGAVDFHSGPRRIRLRQCSSGRPGGAGSASGRCLSCVRYGAPRRLSRRATLHCPWPRRSRRRTAEVCWRRGEMGRLSSRRTSCLVREFLRRRCSACCAGCARAASASRSAAWTGQGSPRSRGR